MQLHTILQNISLLFERQQYDKLYQIFLSNEQNATYIELFCRKHFYNPFPIALYNEIFTFILKYKIVKLMYIVIVNIFLVKTCKYLQNINVDFFTNINNSELVIRIFDKYDIPINYNNIYIFSQINGSDFLVKFHTFYDKNEIKYSKLVKRILYKNLTDTEFKNPIVKLLVKNNIINLNILHKIYDITENTLETQKNIIQKWTNCYQQFIDENDPDYLSLLRLYTYKGDDEMHSVMRKQFIPFIAENSKSDLIFYINELNKGIYNSIINKCMTLFEEDKLVLFRGISGQIVLTKGSIINNMRNQFISFTSNYDIATSFGKIVLRLTIDKNDKFKTIFPIENLHDKEGSKISRFEEYEWLLPLNTSLIITDVLKIYEETNAIIDVKIHNQQYTENITENTFTPQMLENMFENKEIFLNNLLLMTN